MLALWLAAAVALCERVRYGSYVTLENVNYASYLAVSEKFTYSGDEDYYVVGSLNLSTDLIILPGEAQSFGIGFPIACGSTVRFVVAETGSHLSFSKGKKGLVSGQPQLFASPSSEDTANFVIGCSGAEVNTDSDTSLYLKNENYLGTGYKYKISPMTCPNCPVRSGYEYVIQHFREPKQWRFNIQVGVESSGNDAIRTGELGNESTPSKTQPKAKTNDEL